MSCTCNALPQSNATIKSYDNSALYLQNNDKSVGVYTEQNTVALLCTSNQHNSTHFSSNQQWILVKRRLRKLGSVQYVCACVSTDSYDCREVQSICKVKKETKWWCDYQRCIHSKTKR